MEGGGGDRKRKSPPELDFNKLLSDENDVAPPELMVQSQLAAKPLEAVLGDGEDSSRDQNLRSLPDHDLKNTILRMKRMCGMKLRDGGEKLRISLRRHEEELERRESEKVNVRGMDSRQFVQDSVAGDSSSSGAPLSTPAPQSRFGSLFRSKLDEKPSRQAVNALGNDLSALCGCNKREKFKAGSSSRQAPFRAPNHLSVNKDEEIPRKGEQNGRHPCTPRFSREDIPSLATKSSYDLRDSFGPKKNKDKTFVLVDEEEPDVEEVTKQADEVDQCDKESRIYYPSRDDPEMVYICYSDFRYLAPESYLSSTIMNFYIRFLQKGTSLADTEKGGYHFFNTYFYEKLKQDVLAKDDKETSFVKFRRWWKGVCIFQKAYIFLPIHEDSHWSLVIICIPRKEEDSGPILFHLDSLRLHNSKAIFSNIRSFLIEEWKFLRRGEDVPELPFTDRIWQKLSRRIDEKVIEVPQQKNEYDCGLFVLFFMERFIEEAPVRLKKNRMPTFGRQWFRPEAASGLRRKIRNLLTEEFKKASEVRS